jgi:hypothetical protein
MESDNSIVYYTYNSNQKIRQTKSISTSIIGWSGITTYIYNEKDSIIKKEYWDLNKENIENRDSIVYTDTSKVVFEFHVVNELNSKTETITKNRKIVREIEYRINMMSKNREVYIDKEISFIYNGNQLIKKIRRTMANTEWCGIKRPEKTETYTYIYE